MAGFNFADRYKTAGLNPGPEIIGLRQAPFDTIRQSIDVFKAIVLTRLYFGLPVPDEADWFRSAFAETDASFTMVENQREAAVLSACLLSAALEDGKVFAGLTILSAYASANRTPLVLPGLVEEAKRTLHRIAVTDRVPANLVSSISSPAASKATAAVPSFLQGPDWTKVGEILKDLGQESVQHTTTLVKEMRRVLSPLLSEIKYLREEQEMLWWYVGGWSRVLARPFTELKPALAAAMAGLDLGRLTKHRVGPAAAPAILHRIAFAGRKDDVGKVAIKDAVESFPKGSFDRLELDQRLNDLADICPVSAAYLKWFELEGRPGWQSVFKSAAHLRPTCTFDLLGLAMQVYRETVLIASLG